MSEHTNPIFVIVLGALVLASLVVSVWSCREERAALAHLALFALLLLSATALRKRFDLWGYGSIEMGDRYYCVPKVVFLWCLIVVPAASPLRIARGLAMVALVSGLVLNAAQFRFKPYQDWDWSGKCAAIRAGERVELRVNPDWRFHYQRGSRESSGPHFP